MSHPVEFKIADSRVEREAAFRLIHDSYVRSGLDEPNAYGLRVTPYHLLDATTVFVATLDGLVISTVSLVADGELGLPAEVMYRPQIDERRRQGLCLAEVTCLADRRKHIERFIDVFSSLTRLMAQHARSRGIDELIAAVHPRHAPFYVRYLGFEQFAGVSTCPHVNNRPAVGLALSFARCDQQRPECYDHYFGKALPAQSLRSRTMSLEERLFLGRVVEDTSVLSALAAVEA